MVNSPPNPSSPAHGCSGSLCHPPYGREEFARCRCSGASAGTLALGPVQTLPAHPSAWQEKPELVDASRDIALSLSSNHLIPVPSKTGGTEEAERSRGRSFTMELSAAKGEHSDDPVHRWPENAACSCLEKSYNPWWGALQTDIHP